jgi:ADP-ribosylglycohydrolase
MYHVRDGIIGLAVGDAMGVPTEYYSREDLLDKPVIKMSPKISAGIPKGAWSDDTSLTIATMDAITKSGINYTAMADNFVRWFTTNQFCSINESFGIESTTLKSLVRYTQRMEEAYECGGNTEDDNGNGSLMRILPIAYYFIARKDTDKRIFEVVKRTSSITHAHEISVCGCYIYVRLAMNLLRGNNKFAALNQVRKLDYNMFSKTTLNVYKRILIEDISALTIDDIRTTNNVVDTLEAAIWCFLKSNSYKECVLATTNIGGDTDTIGSVSGALAGIFYGYNNIPKDMLNDLRKREYLEDICEYFEAYLKRL